MKPNTSAAVTTNKSQRPQTSTKAAPAKQPVGKPLANNNKKAILNRLNEDMQNIKSPKNSN